MRSAMIVRLAVQYATPVEVHLTCRFLSRSILDFEQFSIFSSQRPSQGPVDHRGHPCCSNVRCMPTEADRPLCGSEKELGILLHLLPPGIYSPSRNPTVSRPVFCWTFFNCGSFETAVPGPPLATSICTRSVASVLKRATFYNGEDCRNILPPNVGTQFIDFVSCRTQC